MKPLVKIITKNHLTENYLVIDCPLCRIKRGEITKSPVKGDELLRTEHQERLEDKYNRRKVRRHLLYLDIFSINFHILRRDQKIQIKCPKCNRDYEFTDEDYKLAKRKVGLNL